MRFRCSTSFGDAGRPIRSLLIKRITSEICLGLGMVCGCSFIVAHAVSAFNLFATPFLLANALHVDKGDGFAVQVRATNLAFLGCKTQSRKGRTPQTLGPPAALSFVPLAAMLASRSLYPERQDPKLDASSDFGRPRRRRRTQPRSRGKITCACFKRSHFLFLLLSLFVQRHEAAAKALYFLGGFLLLLSFFYSVLSFHYEPNNQTTLPKKPTL